MYFALNEDDRILLAKGERMLRISDKNELNEEDLQSVSPLFLQENQRVFISFLLPVLMNSFCKLFNFSTAILEKGENYGKKTGDECNVVRILKCKDNHVNETNCVTVGLKRNMINKFVTFSCKNQGILLFL